MSAMSDLRYRRRVDGATASVSPEVSRPVFPRLSRLIREPLLHFLVAGLVLFCAGQIYREQTSPYRIEMTPRREAELAERYVLQFGGRPDAATLRTLVEQDIHQEILFREGMRLQLDQGDEIVRRRIVQKAQFLLQDTQAPAEPTEVQLQTYFSVHASDYLSPQRVTFSHVYFSTDRGDEAARSRAAAVRETLTDGRSRAPDLGDPFPDLYDFSGYDADEVARVFGHTELSTAVMSAPPGRWAGPFRSSYGWHLIYVQTRDPSRSPAFAAVRERVREDYLRAEQGRLNAAAFAKLAAKYRVVQAVPAQR